jgi:nucleoside-diphosphate-sugar epimerase
MRLLITGAAGFIGRHLAAQALAQGYQVRAWIHRRPLDLPGVETVQGDIGDRTLAEQAVTGCQAVIHAAALTSETHPGLSQSQAVNVEGTRLVVAAAEQAGITRFLLISSMSAFPENPTAYGRSKLASEDIVRASSLAWTIFRPSIVYGPAPAGLFSHLAHQLKKLPVIPIFGDGTAPQRPVHVEDVANAVLTSLQQPVTIGQTYMLGGQEQLANKHFLQLVAQAQGRSGRCIHIPVALALRLAHLLEMMLGHPPLTTDNVLGLVLSQDVDNSSAERDLGYRPRSFRADLEAITRAGGLP